MKEAEVFMVGDMVQWSSQSGGSAKVKTGTIIAVVNPGVYPTPEFVKAVFRSPYKPMFGGADQCYRNEVSYLVAVKTSQKAMTKVYWPITKHLRKGR